MIDDESLDFAAESHFIVELFEDERGGDDEVLGGGGFIVTSVEFVKGFSVELWNKLVFKNSLKLGDEGMANFVDLGASSNCGADDD